MRKINRFKFAKYKIQEYYTVPRLSLWKNGEHTADFRFIDKRISEMFVIGGTSVLLHKYLGPNTSGNDGSDATQPSYINQSEKNIQDLLFLENRDRKYDTSVYTLRGVYQRSDRDFDLSQFGLFISNDILFMTFHLKDMVDALGRKIMAGDVIELLHLKDYYHENEDVPTALKRFYVAGDCSYATEGFSQTWWPHLWRVKFSPLVDSQEYRDIIKKLGGATGGISSTCKPYMEINASIIEQAENDVPKSGYDVSKIYVKPIDSEGALVHQSTTGADSMTDTADETITTDDAGFTPSRDVSGYLTGDGLAPNGHPVGTGISFPSNPQFGEYFLRLDYMPNRLFRFDGRRWVKVEDNVRANINPGAGQTQLSGFINNTKTYVNSNGEVRDERQSLSKALGLKPDR